MRCARKRNNDASAVAGVRGPAPLSPAAQARQDEVGKRLAPGMTIALNNAALVREAASLCARAHPASAQLYRQAYRDWEDRNGAVVKRAYVLLAKYFPKTPRSEADAIALRSAYDTLGVVNRGVPAQRIKWCAQTGADIANGKIDLINMEQVALMLREKA
ncbi:hypothetical protein [Massilia suwonensis]|uniref:J domain-containing protein n=1 Tax=Massilia suwonensis TaxID=648895 RepID=A0ABW0MMX5_9BURK